MRYVSTRGQAPPVDFREALLAGFVSDDFDASTSLPAPWVLKIRLVEVLSVAVPLLDAEQREALAVADLIDLFAQANAKKGRKPDPYPRPWHKPKRTRLGRITRTQAEIRAALAARGHH